MISARRNFIRILKILIIICILYTAYAWVMTELRSETMYGIYQEYGTNEQTLDEIKKEYIDGFWDNFPGHVSIFIFAFSYYLFFNLSERWILNKKINPLKIALLIVLNILGIVGLIGYIFFEKYEPVRRAFNISLIQETISEIVIWIAIISSILWIILLKILTSKNKNIKTLVFEKLYVYIRRIFIFTFLIIEIYFSMGVTNYYQKKLYSDYVEESIAKLEKNEYYDEQVDQYNYLFQTNINYWVQVGFPILIIGAIIGYIYIKIYKELNEEIHPINSKRYVDKTLIIYCSPWITGISPYNTMGILSKKRTINHDQLSKNFNYIIEDAQYIFTDYRVIDNNIIDITKFENIVYVFEYDKDCEKRCDKRYNKKFLNIIDECEKNKIKFAIINNNGEPDKYFSRNNVIRKLKENYSYAYFENISDLYSVIDELDNKFNKRITNIINLLGESDSSQYIKDSLESICISHNFIEKFYTLLKLLEYIIQYEALGYIAENKLYEMDKSFYGLPTLGYWDSINKDEKIEISKEKQIKIKELLKKLDFNFSDNITLFDLKHAITEIHNRNLGHGTISYSISKDYNELLIEISEILIPNFERKNISLDEYRFIYKNNEEKFSIKEDEFEYIYSGISHNTIEYFCFENGETKKLYRNDGKKFILNLGEEHIA